MTQSSSRHIDNFYTSIMYKIKSIKDLFSKGLEIISHHLSTEKRLGNVLVTPLKSLYQ